MQSTSIFNTSIDNVLDQSSCFGVDLPVTIIANGITITIETIEDLDTLEDIFDEFDDDEDYLDFLFPVTIIFNDYSELVINDQDELDTYINNCSNEEIEDDIIECVDFVYPITMSIYNSQFQVIDNITFNNDSEFYAFLDTIDDENDDAIIASLNFPVSLVYADGTEIEVTNNAELQAAIAAAGDDCDDDYNNCTVEEVSMYLQECHWYVESYNQDDNLQDFDLSFQEDGTLQVVGPNAFTESGSWNISVSNDALPEIVIAGLQELEALNGTWTVFGCDDDEFYIKKETDNQIIEVELDQECEDDLDCTAQEMIQELKECKWWMNTSLFSPNYSGPLFFEDNNVLLVGYPDANQLEGSWSVEITGTGTVLNIEVGGDYQAITLDWTLIDCDEDRFEFISGDNTLVLEQECWEEEDPLSCYETTEIILCDENNDGSEVFNLYSGLTEIENCEFNNTISVSFHETLVGAEADFDEILEATSYTNITNPQTVYVRVELFNNPSVFEVMEIDLILEDCSQSSCSEEEVESYLMDCHWVAVSYDGDDQLSVYNLNFNENMDLTIEGEGVTYAGVWSTSINPNNVVTLDISQLSEALGDLNNQWQVVECSAEQMVLLGNNNVEIILERDCN